MTRDDLSSLRSLTHIGASAPKSLRLRARKRLGPIIGHAYGASEIGLVSALAPIDHDVSRPKSFTSAGRIQPEVDVRFRQADGRLVDSGGIGIIEVRSPAMASGYQQPWPQLPEFSGGTGTIPAILVVWMKMGFYMFWVERMMPRN